MRQSRQSVRSRDFVRVNADESERCMPPCNVVDCISYLWLTGMLDGLGLMVRSPRFENARGRKQGVRTPISRIHNRWFLFSVQLQLPLLVRLLYHPRVLGVPC